MPPSLDRRHFLQTTAASVAASTAVSRPSTAPAANPVRPLAPKARVRLGVIGIANRGTQVSRAFLEHDDVEIVAICDVYQPQMDKAAAELNLPNVKKFSDFRELLKQEDVDAVLIATPDHWHALQTIMACRAGKDVYVEKPLSVTIQEGRKMVQVARETQRVVQVGTHRRSSPVWQKAVELIHQGAIGQVMVCQAYRTMNMVPDGIGKCEPESPPPGLNWDMWLGPRANRSYQANITPYKFRWWQDYSSQFGNWGVHYFDVMRWILNEQSPRSVCCMGGIYAVDDDRTIPDTAQAIYEFPSGSLALFGTYESFGNSMLKRGEFEARGTKGTLYVDSSGIHIVPERRGQFQTKDPGGEALEVPFKSNNHGDTTAHTRNFLDCIRTRQRPNADVETGHRSTVMSLLANLSLEVKQRLEWDAEKETLNSPNEANDLLHYEYREPWSLDL